MFIWGLSRDLPSASGREGTRSPRKLVSVEEAGCSQEVGFHTAFSGGGPRRSLRATAEQDGLAVPRVAPATGYLRVFLCIKEDELFENTMKRGSTILESLPSGALMEKMRLKKGKELPKVTTPGLRLIVKWSKTNDQKLR